ncbi:MAG: hypothetical protein COY81_01125 [Candidatus Pacebacteria bacterium CG_4_10_14_0_8_um_filter_43_12]|nr:MAG: hypothetical protein COU66_01560 [Candidatus Pacebacteria bacterium CG10_big_fil_rev_8_21_14_0_10_44_11]PIY79748.1 MAG: hypothetical protein COY81_01125 [Candidatus Pacebacteria bacterium CG_4_10_14_0_8_um_filter_43_12]
MITLLYLIPVFSIVSAIVVYRLNGKREFLKLDLVQFFYAFILSPVLFIWLKTFLYFLLRVEVTVSLSSGQLFLFDTIFSTLFLYIFAFVVIHSLTKSFNLKRTVDPLYNLFEDSEFFHLWLTHLMMYLGGMVLTSVLALLNIWFPLEISLTTTGFYFLFGSGFLCGFVVFLLAWLSDPKQEEANFMRLMKLAFGFFFLIHVVLYFVFNPPFSAAYGLYWWSLNIFTALVICSLFSYKSERATSFFEQISLYFKHSKWGENIQLFKQK